MAIPRILGRFGEAGGGRPTLVVVSGLHGNEPAGVLASQRVAASLAGGSAPLKGHIVFVAGNLGALAEGVRFRTRDLNRAWTAAPDCTGSAEDVEQCELLAVLDEVLAEAGGRVHVLDLHTTSGRGGPFATAADRLENRALALALPVPLVLGLEELVEGTLHDHLDARGCISVAFESGQHDDPASVDCAEAAIWITLVQAGIVDRSQVATRIVQARACLAAASRGRPRAVEMRHRHPVREDDAFVMDPGFENFQPLRRGQRVAQDRAGAVHVPMRGRMLMPLYQPQGEDGYFVVREFGLFWLRLSSALRRLGVQRWVHLLPGVRVDRADPSRLLIDRRVARWYALQLLHLLGYRKRRDEGDTLVVVRHPEAR